MRKTVNPNTIQANPDNPRTITEDKLNLLVKSLKEFPEMLEKRPIVVTTNEDGTFTALGGNMRARAAQQAGIESIEIDTVDDWSEDKRKQFIIKDNASFGEWDWDLLANEWNNAELNEWGLDVWNPEDIDLEQFFENDEGIEKSPTKIVLEYSEDDYPLVLQAFEDRDGSKEDIVFKLLGL